uniref:frataxin, mitochondrial n=1 Tax=Erigeron canadensis TaxID=72917 RepID=UPI001CB9CC96|nr:frataxin, mitochondrial [Erigeron canadensis]
MAAASSSLKLLKRISINSIIHQSRFLSSSSSSSNPTFLSQYLNYPHSVPPSSSNSILCNNNIYNQSSHICSRSSRNICSNSEQGPAPIDYSALLQEEEFHKLADATIQDLLEKIEEYGDSVDIDGFDIDYGNQVLTMKLGNFGTYVLNKQTPNRQIWMSSPVSGPSRFDWDRTAEAWIYRRTKSKLLEILENEIQQLCGDPIKLS